MFKFNGALFVSRLLQCYAEKNHEKKPLQKQLASDLHVEEKTISNWKKGEMPNASTLLEIIDKYDVSLDYLFGFNDNSYIFDKRDMLDLMKIIMVQDFKERSTMYAGYDISFDTKECKDGKCVSTITFKPNNNTQYDYISHLFSNYSVLQDLKSRFDEDYLSKEQYLQAIDMLISKTKDDITIHAEHFNKK